MNIPDEVAQQAIDAGGFGPAFQIIAEWARKEAQAERDEAVRQLGEVRQAFGDMEARVVELEAVNGPLIRELTEARLYIQAEAPHEPTERRIREVVAKAERPRELLAEHDKAVAAEALRGVADALGGVSLLWFEKKKIPRSELIDWLLRLAEAEAR